MPRNVTQRGFLTIAGLALMLAFTGLFQPRSVQAAPPPPLTGSDGVTINPDGGTDSTPGLRIDVYNVQYQVFRDGKFQVYQNSAAESYSDWLLWLLPPDSKQYGGYNIEMLAHAELGLPEFSSPNDYCYWSDTGGSCFDNNSPPVHTLETPDTLGADRWRATVTMAGNDLYELKLIYTYTAPNYYFDVEAQLKRKSTNTYVPQSMHLYFIADLTLNEGDNGPTTRAWFENRPTFGQFSPTDQFDAFSGLSTVAGHEPTSIFVGYYDCAGNGEYANAATDGIGYSGCSGTGPGNEADPKWGPPFVISADDYQTQFTDQGEKLDGGMGMHWQLDPTASNWKKKLRLVYTDYQYFADTFSFVEPEPEPEPESQPEAASAACDKAPTMRLVPDPLTIAPGTSETLWVEVVNSCTDRPLSAADLLVSFDNGLTAAGEGWLTLGQRIALQGLSLAPGELRAWPLTFTAAPDAAAPLNLVGEVYFAGSRAASIAHSVTVPAPAVVVAPAPTAAPIAAPVVVAEPTTLPNTGNDRSIAYTLLALLAAASLITGLQLRRRRA